jgi:purine-binding chemotaxis protein CheW
VAEKQHTDTHEQVVVFEVAGESYGIDIGRIQEIIRRPEITPVPRAPECIEGVVNLRGRVIPVINMRNRFGMPSTEADRASRIVILEAEGQTIGAAVDAVAEVLRIPTSIIEPPGATFTGARTAHLRGIAKLDERLIVLLSLERLIDFAEANAAVAA